MLVVAQEGAMQKGYMASLKEIDSRRRQLGQVVLCMAQGVVRYIFIAQRMLFVAQEGAIQEGVHGSIYL